MPHDYNSDEEDHQNRRDRFSRETRRDEDYNKRKRSRSRDGAKDKFGRDQRSREFYGKERPSDSKKMYKSDYHSSYSYGGPAYYNSYPMTSYPNQYSQSNYIPKNDYYQSKDPYESDARIMQDFFTAHKTEEWFVEKYHPSFKDNRDAENLKICEEKYNQFIQDLDSGKYDFIELESADGTSSNSQIGFAQDEDDDMNEKNEVKPEDINDHILMVKSIPPSIKQKQILEVCQNVPGFLKLEMNDPTPARKFHRQAFITFSEGTNMIETCKLFDNTMIDGFQLHFVIFINKGNRNKFAPAVSMTDERLRKDLSFALRLCTTLDEEKRFSNIFKVPQDLNSMTIQEVKKKLDQVIMYLRKVHYFEYYNGHQFESEDALKRKYPEITKRSNLNATFNDDWEKMLNSKIENRLSSTLTPSQLKKLGKKNLEESDNSFFNEKTHKVADGKYRCTLCEKLFKGQEYVQKHIVGKHQDILLDSQQEVMLFNNFVSDYSNVLPLIKKSREVPYQTKITTTKPKAHSDIRGTHLQLKVEFFKDPRPPRKYEDYDDIPESDSLLNRLEEY